MHINEATILLNVEASSKEDVLDQMGKNLVELGRVKESFIAAITAREDEYPTGLPTAGVAVAIPHTDVEHVREKTISIATLKKPVSFGVMGGDSSEQVAVKVVFMLAMEEAHSQLTLLQQLMQLFQDETKLMTLAQATDKTEVMQLVSNNLDL
ncbi:PTS system, galactitol-specific IIA component [Bacillus sp. JCM 19046]|nr:PTS system, galactitol-specific IIA component [Bacillus sp. JCM 19045]GAF20102.1 PTS system, galactitol-specific IIA component [Bacillus sp. JCM 19046]